MMPKIITHNAVSLDGSISGFTINLAINSEVTGTFKPDATLVGSSTAKTVVSMYGDSIPDESPADFIKPPRIITGENRPYWVIPDSNGLLQGRLHVFRRAGFCKDVIILLSEKTSESYARYLLERNYETIITGHEDIDLKRSMELLHEKYSCETVLTDSGGILNNLLLEQGLVDEISLLIHPVVVDMKHPKLFRNLNFSQKSMQLELLSQENLDGIVHVHYRVVK